MGKELRIGNKETWYLYPSEEFTIKTIVAVLKKANRRMMGTTELIATVKHIIDSYNKKKGINKKIQYTTIKALIPVIGMIRTCKKVGSRRCLKTWQIKRVRYWQYIPKKK